MTTPQLIEHLPLPQNLEGKVAFITGGSSGIGLATAKLLLARGATVHVMDVKPPDDDNDDWDEWERFHVHASADVCDFGRLRDAFDAAAAAAGGQVAAPDMVFANAGGPVGHVDYGFFEDELDEGGRLVEPEYPNVLANTRGVLNTVKLAWSMMRRANKEGSIVITASTTAYQPEQSVPIFSSIQSFLIGLVRALRHNVIRDNITINAVAPAAVVTGMLLYDYAVPFFQAGIPIGMTEDAAKLLVYAATAEETRKVEVYGKESEDELSKRGRWNGRILVMWGDKCKEVEEPLSDLREVWLGKEFLDVFKKQQALTDWRPRGD